MLTQWKQIHDPKGAEDVLNAFGGFHDSCLREFHIWTEHYVSDSLSMACNGNLDTTVRALVQRQFSDPSAIDMVFKEVTQFQLIPTPDNYDSIVFSASLSYNNGIVTWSEEGDEPMFKVEARQLFWRDASDWMGGQLRYGAEKLLDLPPAPDHPTPRTRKGY